MLYPYIFIAIYLLTLLNNNMYEKGRLIIKIKYRLKYKELLK